jgi:hypothetical protein
MSIDLITGAFLVGIIYAAGEVLKALAQSRQRARQAERVTDLKRAMIDKGMSAADIERVLAAAPPGAPVAPEAKDAGADAPDDPAVLLNLKLAEYEVSPKDMEEILAAFRAGDPRTQGRIAKSVVAMLGSCETDIHGRARADVIERVLIAVRSLSAPSRQQPQPADHRFAEEPSPFRH